MRVSPYCTCPARAASFANVPVPMVRVRPPMLRLTSIACMDGVLLWPLSWFPGVVLRGTNGFGHRLTAGSRTFGFWIWGSEDQISQRGTEVIEEELKLALS